MGPTFKRVFSFGVLFIGLAGALPSRAELTPAFDSVFSDPQLKTVVYLRPSKDGRFLYTSQYGRNVPLVLVFEVQPNGDLKKVGTVTQTPYCSAALDIKLSPDENFFALSCPVESVVAFFARDSITGA